MKPFAMMKSMCMGLFVLGVLAVIAGSAWADDWHLVGGGVRGVEVFVKKNPTMSAESRNVNMKFVNHNDYEVNIKYTVIIRCSGESSRDADKGKSLVKRHGESEAGFSYTICGKDDDVNDVSMIEVRLIEADSGPTKPGSGSGLTRPGP